MIGILFEKALDFYGARAKRNSAELIRAQYQICTRQLPLVYTILLSSIWGVALTSRAVAPAWLVYGSPVVFTFVFTARIHHWFNARSEFETVERCRRAMAQIKLLGAALPIFFTAWALSLFEYGDHVIRVNISYFMAISGICIVVFMMHLRIAAYQVAMFVYIPLVIRLLLTGDSALMTMGVNLLIAAALLVVVVYVQSSHFRNAVKSEVALQRASEHNRTLANLDSLTSLPNRRLFFDNLNREIALAQENRRRLAVGILDLDGFKAVNDLHGHTIGDLLLQNVAERLKRLVGGDILVSRLGGDEFALLIKTRNSDAELLLLGEQICAVLRAPFLIEEGRISISASVGYAVYPDVAKTAHDLYECADYALYQNKRNNRGCPSLFAKEQATELEQRGLIEQAIRSANLDKELSVYFQPIVEVSSGRIAAFEALARWHSPQVGQVAPSVFIPIAEQSGRICEITHTLLAKALSEAANWPHDIKLSFNLSALDVSAAERTLKLASIVMRSDVDPRRIDFEITETAAMGRESEVQASIADLRALGCGISLDDFGTGFSSLSQLHALPLTTIKIDRSFVSDLDKNESGYKIVKSLLSLSRDMGVECIVEGVETTAELDMIKRLGGRLVQGYLWSAPVPAEQVGVLIAKHEQTCLFLAPMERAKGQERAPLS
ncbi:putative bifunctional diguanylate cyclase/phosphodiesterase [Cohaesibacter marisflavi]|uniref:putative bifunctional diguanylate cyclase/phosphodiesterase n=1 Tax=Cohaesibacter marisflavi TaxID=655353 RepID=UPI0029C75A25|nr:EAL domain-containing protein [Cohaesibacter marisflavi]